MSSLQNGPGGASPGGSLELTTPESTAVDAPATDVLDMRPAQPGLARPSTRARQHHLRLRLASWAFTTRRVPRGTGTVVMPLSGSPNVGDLVLARVDVLGQHAGLQLVSGRRRNLVPGDEIVVAYGHRYASNQFESFVPETLGPCHLVAGGGIASRAVSWHVKVSRGPTHITPIGLVGNSDGERLNLGQFAMPPPPPQRVYEPTTVAVVGTAMDSGKTQTCVHLVRGLIAGGLRVGYAKVTGTGAGGDVWWLKDAGAHPVLDFTDLGMPSTYLESPETLEQALETLVAHVAARGVDAVILEIADGVLQRETAGLLKSRTFAKTVGGIVLAAQDAMGASAGVHWLQDQRVPVLALAGVLTASPLQAAEAAAATGLPLFDRDGLATAENAMRIAGQAQHHLQTRRNDDAHVA